jgi:hypothetical protein
MFHEGEDTIDVLLAMALCFVLSIMSLFVGYTIGAKRQKAEAVKAGVAHWGQDEYGKAKFEFNK